MNVDDTIRRSMWNYPTLYKNRTQVLHHLFCVLGNGFDWINGELVNVCDDPDLWKDEHDGIYDTFDDLEASKHDGPAFTRLARLMAEDEGKPDQLPDYILKSNEHIRSTRANIDTLIHTPGPVRHWYPFMEEMSTKYCKIGSIPADVSDDWHAAAIEIAAAWHNQQDDYNASVSIWRNAK